MSISLYFKLIKLQYIGSALGRIVLILFEILGGDCQK